MPWVFVFVASIFSGQIALRSCDRFYSGSLRVTFFDVGQGDSALIRFPGGSAWVVDGGGGWGDWDVGKRDLFLELARMGVLTLDVAVLSHPDADHGKGLRGLMQNLLVKELRWNGIFRFEEHALMRELKSSAAIKGTLLRSIDAAQRENVEGVKVSLVPFRTSVAKNENPLSVWLEFGGCRVLMGGDAEKIAERALVAWDSRPVEILKVNHHGSRSSSTPEFLKALRPRWSVVSVGATNRYGHPAPEVMARLRKIGSDIRRTDQQGYVEFRIQSNGEVTCTSSEGPCGESNCTRS